MFKKLLFALALIGLLTTLVYADFDATKPADAETVAVGTTATRANFQALSGVSGSSPTKLAVGTSLEFEGETADAFETTLTVTDPTADRTTTIPNSNNVTLPSGAVFFMITGSCSAGTTDVTATYLNKFVRINATQGSTGGADTHTHAVGSYASTNHTHTLDVGNKGGDVSDGVQSDGTYMWNEGSDTYYANTVKITTVPGGAAAITGTSASGDNVPAYVTMKCCLVD